MESAGLSQIRLLPRAFVPRHGRPSRAALGLVAGVGVRHEN